MLLFEAPYRALYKRQERQLRVHKHWRSVPRHRVQGLIFNGFLFLSRSTLIGAGDANAALATTLVVLGGRLVAAYVLSSFFGYKGFFFAAPVGFVCGAIFATHRYLSGRWKDKSLVKAIAGREA